jgi:hypothetical protein
MALFYIALGVTLFGIVVGFFWVWFIFRFHLLGDEVLSPSRRRKVMKICYLMMCGCAVFGGVGAFVVGNAIH